MRKIYKVIAIAVIMCLCTNITNAQNNVGMGTTTPDASSILEMQSTTQGVLVPRMLAIARLAIVTPANGLLVYDLDSMCFFYYKAGVWTNMCSAAAGIGPTGPIGPTGIGVAGPTGANGPTGPTGIHCWDLNGNNINDPSEDVNSDGVWDAQDCQGATGANGATGLTGPLGPTGNNGADGATGPIGSTGATGLTGPSGTDGPTGPAGPMGPTGAAGAVGPTGAAGAVGPTGAAGAVGPTGAAGAVGPTGAAGAAGPTGAAGAAGPTGAAGAAGATGPTGPVANVYSNSLTTNGLYTAGSWTNIVSVAFASTKPTAEVIFTASGYGYTGSRSQVFFRILVNGVQYGGAESNVSIYDGWDGVSTTVWSCAYNRDLPMPIGAVTIQVQYYTASITGTRGVEIDAANTSGDNCSITALQ